MDETDYIYETADSLDGRLAAVEAKAKEASEEATEARKLAGLDGPAQAAEDEARRLEAELTDLRRARMRIERGYPYWERFGFEVAVDACGEARNWRVPSEAVTPDLIFPHDANVRVPLDAQTAYRHALDSGLFERFEVCSTFETEGDDVVGAHHYLFGAANLDTISDALFFVADW